MNQIMKSIIRYSLLLCLALVCGFLASCADDLLVTPTTDTVGQPLELTVSQATNSCHSSRIRTRRAYYGVATPRPTGISEERP